MNKPTEELLRQVNGNIAILWGWDSTKYPEGERVWRHRGWPTSKWVGADDLPNWSGDLNLMHEAEASLLRDPDDLDRYYRKLIAAMETLSPLVDDGQYPAAMYYTWHAPAWVRSVCLDRTLTAEKMKIV